MSVALLHDRVLIRKIEAEKTSAGGIVIADSAAEKKYEGTVLAVGEGRVTDKGITIPLTVKVDDTVMYQPNAGITVNINGENLLVIKEEDILAVVGQQ